jgi:hypothetical protein
VKKTSKHFRLAQQIVTRWYATEFVPCLGKLDMELAKALKKAARKK